MTTTDGLALRYILTNDRAGLQRLRAKVAAVAENRYECPECGDMGPHEDNGEAPTSYHFSVLCCACHTSFDPNA